MGEIYSSKCLHLKKRSERAQINDLMMQLKNLEKQDESKPKPSRQQEIIEIRAKIN